MLAKQIKELVPEIPGDVLDVGGADGSRYRHLFHTESFVSLDIDPKLNPTFVASAETMPFSNSTFDTILSSQMLEHVLRPANCLNEISRVLKPNGLLVLTVPQQNELHSEPDDYWRFTSYGIVYLLEESNFEVLKIIQRGGFFSCLAQSIIRIGIDTFQPFSNKFAMGIMTPVTKLLTLIAISLDRRIVSKAARKHALGWCVLARKK